MTPFSFHFGILIKLPISSYTGCLLTDDQSASSATHTKTFPKFIVPQRQKRVLSKWMRKFDYSNQTLQFAPYKCSLIPLKLCHYNLLQLKICSRLLNGVNWQSLYSKYRFVFSFVGNLMANISIVVTFNFCC
jgi:hypothetical protein